MTEPDLTTSFRARALLEDTIPNYRLGAERKQFMDDLKARDIDLYYATLGLMYDVWPHLVTGEDITEGAKPHEIGKFFVGHSADDFTDAPVIPLANTLEKSFEVGCQMLRLEEQFHRECKAGMPLPRRCFPKDIPELDLQLCRVVSQTRQFERMTPSELGLKATEELGEFGTAVLVETGAITHKSLKEPAFGEAADVLLCMTAALAKMYPNMPPRAIADELTRWVHIKQAKYDALLESKQVPAAD
jgi:hypothetical protein